MTTLRNVLQLFETRREPLSLAQMAQELGLEPAMLESMLDFWVRKGRLRETGTAQPCTTCGPEDGCPFVARVPRRYELVTGETLPPPETCPPCGCHR